MGLGPGAKPPRPVRTSVILFHKPKGYLVTRNDERERKTVYHLLPPFLMQEGWFPIGRLDKDSRGLLLFTQDGRLVDRLTAPGRCEKTYEVEIRGGISDDDFSRVLRGVSTSIGILKVHRITKKEKSDPKHSSRSSYRKGKTGTSVESFMP